MELSDKDIQRLCDAVLTTFENQPERVRSIFNLDKDYVDSVVTKAVDVAVESKTQEFQGRPVSLEIMCEEMQDFVKLNPLEGRIAAVEQALTSYNKDVEHMKNSLPGLSQHLNSVVTALSLQNVDLNMHRRKYSLIIQGLKGSAGEDSSKNRAALIEFARDKLKVDNAKESDLAACHRLTQKKDAGIIARFIDLSTRDEWLKNAKNLKGRSDKISISIDLPPCLRAAKKELMERRRDLPSDVKKHSYIKYMKSWPYVSLVSTNKQAKSSKQFNHSFTKEQIALAALSSDPKLKYSWPDMPEDSEVFHPAEGEPMNSSGLSEPPPELNESTPDTPNSGVGD